MHKLICGLLGGCSFHILFLVGEQLLQKRLAVVWILRKESCSATGVGAPAGAP